VIDDLAADPLGLGFVNAAQFLPYALLGLLAGAFVDRWPRKTVLVLASIGRAAALAAIPLLWWLEALTLGVLIALLLLFGACAVFGMAASQSLLPDLVPRDRLLPANARLDQGEAAAQSAGPPIGGILVGLLGAPVTILLDAVSYVADAVLVATLRVRERREPATRMRLGTQIAEGLRWTYRHPILGPLALSTHVWFVANAAGLTVLAVLVLRTLDLGPVFYGVLLAVFGVAALGGASLAAAAGRRWGSGRTIVGARQLYPVAWLFVCAAPAGAPGSMPLLLAASILHGAAAGLENANEMSLRQQVTPRALLGRTSATIRSANRTAAAVGAIAGGVLASVAGDRWALLVIVVVFVGAAAIAWFSPLSGASDA
jgi:MFS family permease